MANKEDTQAPHEHPHAAIPVRVSKESSFAGPGSDAPADTQRPPREAGTDQDHPVNKKLRDEDKSLIGPALGRGGTTGPRLAPVQPTEVFCDPGYTGAPEEKFIPGADPALAKADANFQDVSAFIGKARGS
jgi:hypothetical protein